MARVQALTQSWLRTIITIKAMRLELNMPDDSIEAGKVRCYKDPVARVLKLIRDDVEEPGLAEPPDYSALIREASQSPNRFKSKEEVDAYIRELRDDE